MRHTKNGNAMTSFSLATTENWKDKNSGEKLQKTDWHKIVAFDKIAEIMFEYLKKGSQVYIEGKIQTRSYEKDGSKQWITEIVAKSFLFLSGGKKPGDTIEADLPNTGGDIIPDDDIPF